MRRELPEIPNDPTNPCFGCGPLNPVGLRLRFFRDGESVVSTKVFDRNYSGWPGVVSPSICNQVLVCTGLWTQFAATGQIGTVVRKTEDFGRLFLRVGVRTDIVGRVLRRGHGLVTIRVELRQGKVVKAWRETVRRPYASLAEFRKGARGVRLIPALRQVLPG